MINLRGCAWLLCRAAAGKKWYKVRPENEGTYSLDVNQQLEFLKDDKKAFKLSDVHYMQFKRCTALVVGRGWTAI